MARSIVAAIAAASMMAATAAQAAEMPCASADEAKGFTLRHLQSRLMVAALSCNQKEAYNTFVNHFMGDLSSGGRALIAYFQRTGGGSPALNKHVTDLANAAGLRLAYDQKEYCSAAWHVFWELEQRPEQLADIAGGSLIPTVSIPRSCSGSAATQPQEASLKP